jgi:hypothetical protein
LDQLYAKNLWGQGQTVGVIEYSGQWGDMKDVSNNKLGFVSREIRERYNRNFLPPIGGPGLHPEKTNEWVLLASGNTSHGSDVSSVIMDLAPQTKVLPVSTYNCFEEGSQPRHFYDSSDALMTLAQRKDVGIINISGGWIETMPSEGKRENDKNGKEIFLCKTVYTPRLLEAFKAIAKAGKVVVLAAGNQGSEIRPPHFSQNTERGSSYEFIGHLLENLDAETRKSILIAGNVNPNTHKLCASSNKPGNSIKAQERFVGAPGHHMLSYVDYVVTGTSFSAPYLCAAVALLSSRGYAPKRVVNALLQTAQKDPDIRTYGRGRMIRADKALEWLEKGG